MGKASCSGEKRGPLLLVARWLGILVVLCILAFLVPRWDNAALAEWKSNAHPLVFFTVAALIPSLGFPVTPIYILAGATFGGLIGTLGTMAALAANLTLTFWLAKSGLRPVLERLVKRLGARIPQPGQSGDVRFILLVRLAPGIPFILKSYLLGLAGVRFGPYFMISLVIGGCYAAGFVLLGESFLELDPKRAAAGALILLAFAGVVVWWRRRGVSDPET